MLVDRWAVSYATEFGGAPFFSAAYVRRFPLRIWHLKKESLQSAQETLLLLDLLSFSSLEVIYLLLDKLQIKENPRPEFLIKFVMTKSRKIIFDEKKNAERIFRKFF